MGPSATARPRGQLAWIGRGALLAARRRLRPGHGPGEQRGDRRRAGERPRGSRPHRAPAARFHADEVVMAFGTRRLTTSLATTHLPLASVPARHLARDGRVGEFWLARFLLDCFGKGPGARASRSRRSTLTWAKGVCSATKRERGAPGIARETTRRPRPRAFEMVGARPRRDRIPHGREMAATMGSSRCTTTRPPSR